MSCLNNLIGSANGEFIQFKLLRFFISACEMICSEYFVKQSIEPWISFTELPTISSFLLACNSNLPTPEAIEIILGS